MKAMQCVSDGGGPKQGFCPQTAAGLEQPRCAVDAGQRGSAVEMPGSGNARGQCGGVVTCTPSGAGLQALTPSSATCSLGKPGQVAGPLCVPLHMSIKWT